MILHRQWIAAIFFFYSYFYNQRKYKVVKSAVKLDPRQTHQSAISWPFQHHVFLPWNVKYLHYLVRLPSLLYKHEKRHIILKKLDYFWNFSVHLMIPFRKISFYFGESGGGSMTIAPANVVRRRSVCNIARTVVPYPPVVYFYQFSFLKKPGYQQLKNWPMNNVKSFCCKNRL